MLSDLKIAQKIKLKPIEAIAKKVNIKKKDLFAYGPYIAKVNINGLKRKKNSKLVLVTAMSPTPAGEGKTTTTVGLADALRKINKNAVACLREPSLGPVFGMKGGATGGGFSQVLPMENINLHFTGDFHAITSANNLLAALIDNHIYHGNKLNIDLSSILVRRCLDMNDRSLRKIVQDGLRYKRRSGFDITVASEIMAIFCLASNLSDLKNRLGKILIGFNKEGKPILARDLKAQGAMLALLKDAFNPNLVQTIFQTPVFIHGGPFANIAHGCNSVVATKLGLGLADYVVTEAGFGADLGAEKFLNIKCNQSKFSPNVVVIVATIRALKYHGAQKLAELSKENINALKKGLLNLERHIDNIKNKFGVPVVVALNHFHKDTKREIEFLEQSINNLGVGIALCRHWEKGNIGAVNLAKMVVNLCNKRLQKPKIIYSLDDPIEVKIEKIAKIIYRANKIKITSLAKQQIEKFMKISSVKKFPICIAKTPYSFSSDPSKLGAVINHTLEVKEVRLNYGAGFFVIICGPIMTMPGLPAQPASQSISVDKNNLIAGLF